jgi:hypothetical protein
MAALIISTVSPVTAETDLLDPTTWKASSSVAPWGKDAMTSMAVLGFSNPHWSWEEGNAVELANGSIVNVIRIDGQSNASGTQNVAAVMILDKDGSVLVFDRMIRFPACSSKFVIRRDPKSGLFFTLSTDVTSTAIAQNTVFARNHLVLAVSADIYKWETCTVVLMDDTGLSSVDSARYTGFHYVDWVFDGPDILYAIRTGYRGSNSYHNANRMTVKRVANYSALAHHNGTCTSSWNTLYRKVGCGWCRPTQGFQVGGHGLSDSDCAQRCSDSRMCHAFANVIGPKPGSCVMYPVPANTSSGLTGIDCYVKLGVESELLAAATAETGDYGAVPDHLKDDTLALKSDDQPIALSCPPPATMAAQCARARRASISDCLVCLGRRFPACDRAGMDYFCTPSPPPPSPSISSGAPGAGSRPFVSYWNVGTQGWYGFEAAFGEKCPQSKDPAVRKQYSRDHGPCRAAGICAPLDWSVPRGVDVASQFGIVPLNWTQIGGSCCSPGCHGWSAGLWPQINGQTGAQLYGGIPQRANMTLHLQSLRQQLENWLPDKEWSGNAVFGKTFITRLIDLFAAD